MIHARYVYIDSGAVVVYCPCGWRQEIDARSGRDAAASKAHDEHLATISPDALPPEQQGEQETGTVQSHAVPVSDHPKSTARAMQDAGGGEGHRLPRQGEQ